VTKVHVSLYPRYLLLRTYNRLVAACDIPYIVEEVIEESDLLVDRKLVLLHLLLDLRLHLSDMLPVHAHYTRLSDLRLDLLLDLSQLYRLPVLVKELRDKAIGEVLQHCLVGLQMLVLN
jgi:hypothetical protein